MNATDVIGWLIDDTYYCTACTTSNAESEGAQPIFASSETDSWSHCADCEELIPEMLTAAGVEQVQIALERFLVRREGRPEIVEQWAKALHEYAGAHDRMSVVCDLVKSACEYTNLKLAMIKLSTKYRNALLAIQGTAGAALKEDR